MIFIGPRPIFLWILLTGYIKCGIDRDAPDFEYEGAPFPVTISRDTYALFCEGGSNASFPSGHAARSMIIAIILAYALSRDIDYHDENLVTHLCDSFEKNNYSVPMLIREIVQSEEFQRGY